MALEHIHSINRKLGVLTDQFGRRWYEQQFNYNMEAYGCIRTSIIYSYLYFSSPKHTVRPMLYTVQYWLYVSKVDWSWTGSIAKTIMIQLTFSKNVLMFSSKLMSYDIKNWHCNCQPGSFYKIPIIVNFQCCFYLQWYVQQHFHQYSKEHHTGLTVLK